MKFAFSLTYFPDMMRTESVFLTEYNHDVETEKISTAFQFVLGNIF